MKINLLNFQNLKVKKILDQVSFTPALEVTFKIPLTKQENDFSEEEDFAGYLIDEIKTKIAELD